VSAATLPAPYFLFYSRALEHTDFRASMMIFWRFDALLALLDNISPGASRIFISILSSFIYRILGFMRLILSALHFFPFFSISISLIGSHRISCYFVVS
jgi:hypothetical protein